MTRRDLLKQMLEDRRQRHGEDAFSTQMLKRQLEDTERGEEDGAVGAPTVYDRQRGEEL